MHWNASIINHDLETISFRKELLEKNVRTMMEANIWSDLSKSLELGKMDILFKS